MQKQKPSSPKGAATTAIPDKLYFRIGEVARLCQVQAYVLRFWESEFPQLRPNKSGTGQRLYRRRDVEMALQVKRLLHEEGYTIAGARQILQSDVKKGHPELPLKSQPPRQQGSNNEARLQRLRLELKELLGMLSDAPAKPVRERKTKKAASADNPNLFSE